MGPVWPYSEEGGEVFLGHSVTQHKTLSDRTARAIDEEVRCIIDRNYERAREILTNNLERLHSMAEALIKYETIDGEQIDDIMADQPARPPQDWEDNTPDGDSSADAGQHSKKAKSTDSPIGGAAEQH